MTTNPAARTFSSDFKRFFLRGLVVLLPSVLTLWIVVKAYQFVDNTIAEPINGWVRVGMIQVATAWEPLRLEFDPSVRAIDAEIETAVAAGNAPATRSKVRADLRAVNIRQWWDDHWYLDLIGLVVAIIAVYVAGRLLGGFFGRHIYRRLENFITALPVFKQVYPYVKQVVDFLFSDERPIKFNRVVVLEYPRKGIWSVGFLTGDTMKSIARESGDAVTVFIPSSPTPFTGYTITVPRSEVIELPITVEEAIRFAVTGGVLIPGHQLHDQALDPGGHEVREQSPVLPLTRHEAPQSAAVPGPTESRRDAG
jgi:uncharacterized membrane protein